MEMGIGRLRQGKVPNGHSRRERYPMFGRLLLTDGSCMIVIKAEDLNSV
jgi:hypothetical protein